MSAGAAAEARRPHRGAGRWLTLALLALGVAAVLPGDALAAPARPDSAGGVRSVAAPSPPPHRVIAYYFHTTQRCVTCRKLEAYSREAIERAFAQELEDGRLVWRLVNLDLEGNEHFVKDYKLYTKSLVLVNEVRGRRPEWKNLEKIWQLLGDKEAFLRYVQKETRGYLANARS